MKSDGIAEQFAELVCSLRSDPGRIPANVKNDATQRLLDNFGCISFGRTVEPARKIADLVTGMGQGNCRLIGSAERTGASAAALAHGTLAQSFELNDLGVYVHPGACIVPACLAGMDLAEGEVSGADFIAAMVAGYEVTVRLSECVGPSAELDIGWHTPPFHGAVGAAASTAMLLGLDKAGIAQAMVIAADIAGGGLMLARLGSDIKRVHCGRGAETGVLSALMAQKGLRSRLDTFEHPDWGYCRTMTASATGFNLDAIRVGLGEDFVGFRRTAMKYYPVGAEVIGMIDAISQLKAQQQIKPSDIEDVEIGTPVFFVKAEGHEFPETDAQIHFNSEYGVAMALIYNVRPVYEDRSILKYWLSGYKQPEVKDLASKIRHVVNQELDRKNPYGIDSSVTIRLKDGTVLENRTDYLKRADSAGTMQFAAMGEEKIVRKFRALTDEVLTAPKQDMLISTVLGLPRGANARHLWNAFDS
ncbi:MAG: MmgE/PrpD family protein [Polaromonas sp.]|uniref:MmgE/PrpD family protein n=1 Tax=Polaromonas sp. TaxID=1869339 RepID=UPI0027323107|nr:MmgE/PrpD family protein [Polaromonas sp.]MDP3799027.1 MmgE/PrpD family protein [Polaromonas sp.]